MDSSDAPSQIRATQQVRKLLSREREPPIDRVIEAGIVPRLVKFLRSDENNALQFEAAWALTNIASGSSGQTRVVVQAQAVPEFVRLLSSPNLNVAEQSAWALGNIAGDSPELRDYVVECGILKPLISLLGTDNLSLCRNAMWTLSNCCRTKSPPPPPIVYQECLPVLSELVDPAQDTSILTDACWALSYLSDGSDDKIQAVVNSGVVTKLAELLKLPNDTILTPALRTLGNIVTGNDVQTQAVIDSGALPWIGQLLCHPKANLQKEAAWAISNITAGNSDQVQAIIDNNILPSLINLLKTGDIKAQKETIWAVTNFTSCANGLQIATLLNAGALQPYFGLLECKDPKLVLLILDGLKNIFEMSEKGGHLDELCVYIEEYGGLDMIENLQKHENEDIYNAALHLIEKYFGDEEGADEVVSTMNGDGFEFPMRAQATKFTL